VPNSKDLVKKRPCGKYQIAAIGFIPEGFEAICAVDAEK
jgi:hypothetical protein